jgi:hypothetical protein
VSSEHSEVNTHYHNHHSHAGQAMIELMIGVITILILLVGTVQFLAVADAHSGIDSTIRGQTGVLAMSPLTIEDMPRYIQTWQPGPDGQRFTADDQATCIGPTTITTIANDSVYNMTDWNEFANLTQPSSLDALHQAPPPLMALGFRNVQQSTTVPVSQFAQELFYGNAFVTVKEDVWMPIMNGLY